MLAEFDPTQVTSKRMPQRPVLRLPMLLRDKLAAVAAPHTAANRTVGNPMVAATISNRWLLHQTAEQNSSVVFIWRSSLRPIGLATIAMSWVTIRT
jgi:hypothetical protein